MADSDASSSPMALFAAELKRLRDKAGLSREQLAAEVLVGPDMIISVENARRKPSKDMAVRADELFGTDGQLTRLQLLVEDTWVLPWFRDLVEVEQRADTIRLYEPYGIPALLQTADYTRAMTRAERPMLPLEDIDRAVELRAARQNVLTQDDPAELWAVVEEAALLRLVGGDGLMRLQYEHLAAMAEQPNITVQIIQNSRGATCAYGRAFVTLTSNGSSLVYLEDISSARYIRRRSEVRRYMVVFDYLRAAALDDIQSINLITEMNKQ